jgi:hypothetical protein
MSTLTRFCFVLAMALVVPVGAPFASASRTTVVAELFTSEGCSSCPPADALVRQLATEQPFDGVEIIALEEHVDYWDRLGWRDPFSSAQFTTRQSEYDARVFRSNNIYTPQLVIDGASECVGSARNAVSAIIARAARQPRATVRVQPVAVSGRVSVTVNVEIPAAVERRGVADVFVVLAEHGLVSAVQRGENRGRTLVHGDIARSLTAIGELPSRDRMFTAKADLPISPEWKAANLRVVGFVQERDSRRILGGGATETSSTVGSGQ